MSIKCKDCWTPRLVKQDINPCKICIHQPGMKDMFISYPATCKFGYKDCIHDPGYIFVNYPDYYKELYGNVELMDAAQDYRGCMICSEECCYYDYEDK